jgi:pSer/pThr/pTyr-binding forkhead associated (FHA) protein
MSKLIMKFNDAVMREVPLQHTKVTVGRKSDNDIVVDNPAVSGHHAQVTHVQSVFFIEDLGSTNGTYVNEKRIERRQLAHGDRILIGKHVFIYEDDHPPERPRPSGIESDKTIILDPRSRRETEDAAPAKTPGPLGMLEVVSGRTDHAKYDLNARLTIVGSQAGAGVRLSGWFAPKTAALISRLPDGYYISTAEGGRPVLVNGLPIDKRADLKDGDLIEVAGVKMYFFMRS